MGMFLIGLVLGCGLGALVGGCGFIFYKIEGMNKMTEVEKFYENAEKVAQKNEESLNISNASSSSEFFKDWANSEMERMLNNFNF